VFEPVGTSLVRPRLTKGVPFARKLRLSMEAKKSARRDADESGIRSRASTLRSKTGPWAPSQTSEDVPFKPTQSNKLRGVFRGAEAGQKKKVFINQ
jgi:hypothetical protein